MLFRKWAIGIIGVIVRYRDEIVNFVHIFVLSLLHEHQAAFKPTATVSSFKALATAR